MAFVLAPEEPLSEWLNDLDAWLARSPGFFIGRPIVLDLAAVGSDTASIAQLVGKLDERKIRVLGLEGVHAVQLGPELPPVLREGRPVSTGQGTAAAAAEKPAAPAPKPPTSLLLEQPVRSGQSIVFMEGDVTVLGSVGSGAEIVAGGSIHVYGTLRGRAMAGASGNPRGRIFCQKIEAELLAIDGYYRTAEEIDPKLRSRPTQAWLEGGAMMITPLN